MPMQHTLADTAQYFIEAGGADFDVLTFNGYEELSRLSRFNVTVYSKDPAVDIHGLIRQPVEIRMEWDIIAPKEKNFYGIIASISQTSAFKGPQIEEPYGYYSLEIVPTLWLLGQKSNCKIWQMMTTDAIIADVLGARGMAGHFEMRLSGGYQVREFCLQYRETDLAFVSRLMEEEGMFYYFDHSAGKDMMIIGDSPGAYSPCWPETTVRFQKGTGAIKREDSPDLESVSQLTYEENAYTGKVAYRDWDYREPMKPPVRPEGAGPEHGDLEVYDYHLERYLDPGYGAKMAQMAADAQAAMRKTLSGSGTFRSITCGGLFTIYDAYRGDLNREWMVVSMSHSATQQATTGVDYTVSFTCIPSDTVFRPLPRTPQPHLTMQTATVVGPPGAECYMDEYGRAKVQFHWDLDHDYGPDASCWIRVAQHYAGLKEGTGIKHGFQWHPLIDDEVIVDFLEGDPDNPIIIGSVYNYEKIPPIKPEEMIRNIILTRYQHRLLFDDKEQAITLNTPYPHTLKMDDPAKKITLDTRYQHQLEMWDPHENNSDIPSVQLKTGGSEVIRMEDEDSSMGNNIKISTADGHFQHFAEGDERGITIETKEANVAKLDDKRQNIKILTTNGHQVLMDDANETIVITSKKNHRVEINDKKDFIQASDAQGSNHILINIADDIITVETKKGDMNLLVPKGQLKIDADSIDIKAKKNIDIDCNNMKTKAKTTVQTDAATIKEKAKAEIKMEAMNITSKAKMQNKRQGVMVESKASGINTIKGTLVKIN